MVMSREYSASISRMRFSMELGSVFFMEKRKPERRDRAAAPPDRSGGRMCDSTVRGSTVYNRPPPAALLRGAIDGRRSFSVYFQSVIAEKR